MFRILGSVKPFAAPCDRRQLMQVGAASLGLPQLLFHESLPAAETASESAVFGRAKNILLIYLQGAASQFETWDPKPGAPEEIRGKWRGGQKTGPGCSLFA